MQHHHQLLYSDQQKVRSIYCNDVCFTFSTHFRPAGSGKALKLGGKGKDVDSFVDKLRQEGTEVITQATSRAPSKAPTPTVPMSSIHLKIDEKITLSAGRHGGLQNMEVRGMALLRVSDPALTRICLNVDNSDNRGFQMQVSWNS